MDIPFEISYRTKFQRRIDWPVDVGIAAGGILGYLVAWIGLVICFAASHWLGGVIGALAGGLAGWAWFKVKIRNH